MALLDLSFRSSYVYVSEVYKFSTWHCVYIFDQIPMKNPKLELSDVEEFMFSKENSPFVTEILILQEFFSLKL